jgi:hypothetical protein
MAKQHLRAGSMDDLPPELRTTTVAALRRGDIKISEPVPLQNSGPSPIWKTSHPPTDSVMGFNASDGSQFQADMSSAIPEDGPAHNSIIAEDAPPLRHKRSSGFMRDKESLQDQSSAPSSHPRSSTIDSQDMGTPNSKKKRRSGSLKMAFRRMFSKREKTAPNRATPPAKQSRHEYHKSVSLARPRMSICLTRCRTRQLCLELLSVVSARTKRKHFDLEAVKHMPATSRPKITSLALPLLLPGCPSP